MFLRDCTVVSPYALLLFGGPITILHQVRGGQCLRATFATCLVAGKRAFGYGVLLGAVSCRSLLSQSTLY